MKPLISVFFILLVLLVGFGGVDAKTSSIDTMRVEFEARIVSGDALRVKLQVNFNVSELDVVIDARNDTFYVYSGQFDTFSIGDWVDIQVDPQFLLEPGEYQGGVIGRPHDRGNDTMPTQTLFFDFFVIRVLSTAEAAGIFIGIFGLVVSPFFADKDKARIDKRLWNNMSSKQYLLYYPTKIFRVIKKIGWIVYWILFVADIGILLFGAIVHFGGVVI